MKNLIHILLILLLCYQTQAQWHQVNSNTTEDISQMVFINSHTGFFVSGNSIYKTTDAGENWSSVFAQTNLDFHSIGIINNEIYAFAKQNGSDKLIQSSNNGNTWNISTIAYGPINKVQTNNNNIFLLDGNDDNKLKKLTTSGMVDLEKKGLYGVNQEEIIIMPTYTIIYKSIDSGQTWSALSNFPNNFGGNNAAWSKIKSFGDTIVLTASYGPVVHFSPDNGSTWESRYAQNIPVPPSTIITDSGFLYGASGFNDNINFMISTNYGNSWEVLQSGILGNSAHDFSFYFYDNSLGFAFTNEGVIYKTSNGGGLSVGQANRMEKKIKIYPNPAIDNIIVETSGLSLTAPKLYTLQGKEVKLNYKPSNEGYIFNISSLASGIYLLELQTLNNEKFIKKLMVK